MRHTRKTFSQLCDQIDNKFATDQRVRYAHIVQSEIFRLGGYIRGGGGGGQWESPFNSAQPANRRKYRKINKKSDILVRKG